MTKASVVVLSVVPDLCMMEIGIDDCKKMYETMTEESKEIECPERRIVKEGRKYGNRSKIGNAVDTIISTAKEKGADMIVVGFPWAAWRKKYLWAVYPPRLLSMRHVMSLLWR